MVGTLVKVTPEDFQIDGNIQPVVNSTLADDDELNVHKSQVLFSMVTQAPQLFNPARARDTVLIALGEGSRLAEWMPPPPTGPVPPEPAQARVNLNAMISLKDVAENLGEEEAKRYLQFIMSEREPKDAGGGPYGIRLIHVQGNLKPVMEPHAHAAIMTGLQNDQSIMRNIQYAVGESNLSAMSNVDPQQARTATGARIMAFNQDTLTKEELAMNNESLKADAEMMRQLCRSELGDELTLDLSPYARAVADQQTDPNAPPPTDIGMVGIS